MSKEKETEESSKRIKEGERERKIERESEKRGDREREKRIGNRYTLGCFIAKCFCAAVKCRSVCDQNRVVRHRNLKGKRPTFIKLCLAVIDFEHRRLLRTKKPMRNSRWNQ